MSGIPSFPFYGRESYSLSEEPTASVSSVSFGDGYTMDAEKGIRPISGKWSVEYLNVSSDVGDSIYGFLISLKCVHPFVWRHPRTGVEYVVKCRTPPKRQWTGGSHQTITATYEEA